MFLSQFEEIEETVENFNLKSELYYEKAKIAGTKSLERDLIELVYKEIIKIDIKLGAFEINLNKKLETPINQWITKNVKNLSNEKVLSSDYRENPSFIQKGSTVGSPLQTKTTLDMNVTSCISTFIHQFKSKIAEDKNLTQTQNSEYLIHKKTQLKKHLNTQL